MNADAALRYVETNHRAVLVTHRRDGGLQTSPIAVLPGPDGTFIISTRSVTAKARNLARDPRATLCVFPDSFSGSWVHVDGEVTVLRQPEALPALADFYHRRNGEDTTLPAFRQRMEQEGRVLLSMRPTHIVGPA